MKRLTEEQIKAVKEENDRNHVIAMKLIRTYLLCSLDEGKKTYTEIFGKQWGGIKIPYNAKLSKQILGE